MRLVQTRVSGARVSMACVSLGSMALAMAVAGCSSPAKSSITGSMPPEQQLVTGRYINSTQPVTPGVAREMAGSLPVAVAMSADLKYAVIAGQGYRPTLTVIEVATGKLISKLDVPKPAKDKTLGLYHGLTVSPDGTVYASQGAHASVGVYHLSPEGQITENGSIATRTGDLLAGVALDGRGNLFVANNCPTSAEAPLNVPGAVIALDTKTRKEISRFEFASPVGTTNFPLAVAVTKDGKKLFVASQRDNVVYVLDATDPAAMKLVTKIPTGSNPVAMLLDEPTKTLYVANADSDTVSVVDAEKLMVKSTLLVRPTAAQNLPAGSPTGLALTPDKKTLLVSVAELNAVAVIDVEEGELEGFVPAGWFASAVATDGKRMVITNAKGTTTRYPKTPGRNVSPLTFVEGDVLTRDIPKKAALEKLTEETLELARVTPSDFRKGNPIAHVGVEHVIYIIKENRTYDQVFGDLPQGNGDPAYVMFGRDNTPNLHALVERFALLDNFYDCGDVSGEGWVWSTQAIANEYVTRNVPYSYSGRGREYDYEGLNNGYPTAGFPAKGPDGKPLSDYPAFANGAPRIRDVAYSPSGALWDLCKNHGRTYRNYGMFLSEAGSVRADEGASKPTKNIFPDNYPATPSLQPGGHDLEGLTNIDYRRFDMDYPDSDAPGMYYRETGNPDFLSAKTSFGKYNSPSRFSEWKREFDLMIKKDPTGKAVPNMMFVRFGNDHTQGAKEGKHAPKSMVADNDYAVGQLVEAVSHSPIWGKTAIFVLEDDAQNGPDHIDTHRSICLVISPWVKRATVEKSFHNTVSCIRTMELLLALPPMNANDAAARPMTFFGLAPDNIEPYTAIKPNPSLISLKNRKKGTAGDARMDKLIDKSNAMDFAHADKAPADELNEIIWAVVMGLDSEQPPTPNGPINHAAGKADDDDK